MRADLAPAGRKVPATRWRRAGLLAVQAVATLLVAYQAAAGEKIQIGGAPEKVDLPKDIGRELNAPPGDYVGSSLRGGVNSTAPVVPMPNQPTFMRNPKLEEWLDRRKNWMFQSPDSMDRDKALRETFGIQDYDFTTSGQKPKKIIQEFYDSSAEKKNPMHRPNGPSNNRDQSFGRNEFDLSRRDQAFDFSGKKEKDNPGIIRELDPAILFNWRTGPESLSTTDDGLPRSPYTTRGFGDNAATQKLPGQAVQESGAAGQPRVGDKLWDIGNKSIGRIMDPINDQSDATRFAINPVTARKASVPLPESSSVSTAPSPIFGSSLPAAGPSRPEFFGISKDQNNAGSSLIPAISTPASTHAFQPKPAVLDIPRPKF